MEANQSAPQAAAKLDDEMARQAKRVKLKELNTALASNQQGWLCRGFQCCCCL
jgi:hypothetical protein